MKSKELEHIALKYGTPAFIFDTESLRRRVLQMKDIMGREISLCYAMKANPFLTRYLIDEVDAIEVCSPGELKICKLQNIPPEKIIYSGVVKGQEDIKEALDYGVETFTAESLNQLALVSRVAEQNGRCIEILLRLNAGSQFGMCEEDFLQAIKNREKYKGIKIVGLHYFVFTQRKKESLQREDLQRIEEFIRKVREESDFEFVRLEYGPGLSVPLFTDDDFSNTLRPLEVLVEQLRTKCEKLKITIELGRFLVQESGYYITKVVDIKHTDQTNYCLVDGGIHHLNYIGNIMGMRVPIIEKIHSWDQSAERKSMDWCICGSLCTTGDVLVRKTALDSLNIGDILAFKNAGAYSVTEGIALFLSRCLPRILVRTEERQLFLERDFLETYTLSSGNVL